MTCHLNPIPSASTSQVLKVYTNMPSLFFDTYLFVGDEGCAMMPMCKSKDNFHPDSGWCMPLILALRKQRQAVLCEFENSLMYRVSSRLAWAT